MFLLPGLGAYFILLLAPSLASLGIALLDWPGLSPDFTFVGLANFARLAEDPVLPIAIANALRNIFLATVIQVPLGLLLGYLLSRRVRGGKVFLFFYFLPVIIAEATLAVMWRFVYDSQFGPLTGVLNALGLHGLAQPWLSADGIVQWTVLIPGAWAWVGFNVVLFLTAINGIPQELFDAATVDGASPIQELWHVVLPSIRGVYVTATALAIAGSVSPFLYPLILTDGGPLDRTQSFMTYAFEHISGADFRPPEWGYAAAIGVVHFGFALVFAGLVWRFGRRGIGVGR